VTEGPGSPPTPSDPDDPTRSSDPPEAPDEVPAVPAVPPPAPPGTRVFSLEARRAPGLYFAAWILSVGGAALFFIALFASLPVVGILLALAGTVALGLGMSAAAGYQVLARADRHPGAYRGPAPLLVLGAVLAFTTSLVLVLGPTGILDPRQPLGFAAAGLIVSCAYALGVQLFVVRTGALGWAEMGWPVGPAARGPRYLEDALYAAGATVLVTFAVLVVGGILGLLLGVEAPQQFPQPRTTLDSLAITIAVSFVAPIGEELFFRGFALTAWQRDLGAGAALLRSSLLFAVLHVASVDADTFLAGARQALLAFLVILPTGLFLGWLFQRRGIVASISGHLTYNSLLLALLALAGRMQPPA
jgi:membrane protease YdiL (CAAX protease family)